MCTNISRRNNAQNYGTHFVQFYEYQHYAAFPSMLESPTPSMAVICLALLCAALQCPVRCFGVLWRPWHLSPSALPPGTPTIVFPAFLLSLHGSRHLLLYGPLCHRVRSWRLLAYPVCPCNLYFNSYLFSRILLPHPPLSTAQLNISNYS